MNGIDEKVLSNNYGTFILTIKEVNEIEEKYKKLLSNISNVKVVRGDDESLSHHSYLPEISTMLYGKKLTKGEINCARGHREMWQLAKNEQQKWAIFLEDDADLIIGASQIMQKLLNHTTNQPIAIILGHSKTIKKNLWFENLKIPLHNIRAINGVKLGEKKQNLFGTVGYMLNDKAIELLVSLPPTFWKADDWRIYENSGLKTLHLLNPCIWENFLSSSTGNSCEIHHNIFSKNFLREIISAIAGQIRRNFL